MARPYRVGEVVEDRRSGARAVGYRPRRGVIRSLRPGPCGVRVATVLWDGQSLQDLLTSDLRRPRRG